jgi:hypothetical protein
MAALSRGCGGEREHVGALPQHPVDQVLEHRHAAFRVQALAVHDAHAAEAVAARIREERTQHRFGARRIGRVQVEFVLRGVVAAAQALQDPARHLVAAPRERIAGFDRVGGQHPPEFVLRLRIVARGHARDRARRRRARRRGRCRQLAHRADGFPEQGGIVLAFGLRRRFAASGHGAKPNPSRLSFVHARTGQQR